MATRTITLTGRPPVSIDEDQWPTIAKGTAKEFDNQYEFQANRISNWGVYVRQHADGRALVYAVYRHTSNWQGARGYDARRGVLLPVAADMDDICRAIETVCDDIAKAEAHGDDASRWPTLAAECIADLPAETI